MSPLQEVGSVDGRWLTSMVVEHDSVICALLHYLPGINMYMQPTRLSLYSCLSNIGQSNEIEMWN